MERKYESMFICPSETPQKKVDELVEKLKAAVTQGKGTVTGVQNWGRRRLAYPINRHRDGLYVYMDFTSGFEVPKALTGIFRVTDFIIRFVTVKKEEPTDLPPKRPSPSAPAAGSAPASSPQKPK